MDANKLLEILNLLEADEVQFLFGEKISEIRELIAQNNEEASNQIKDKVDQLEANIKQSRSAQFAKSEFEILLKLQADRFFGLNLNENIKEILATNGYLIASKFTQFKNNRSEKYNNLIKLKNSLSEAGVAPYKQEEGEVGILIPEEYSEISSTAKYLEKFGQFVHSIQDAHSVEGDTLQPVKISRLNKGSSEFFVLADPATISTITQLLSDLATIYLAIRELNKRGTESNSDIVLNTGEREEIESVYKKIATRKLKEYIDSSTEKIAGAKPPENKARLRTSLKLLVKWISLGIHVEIVYKKTVEASPATTENAEELQLQELERNRRLKITEMYKLPAEHLKLPEPTEEDEE